MEALKLNRSDYKIISGYLLVVTFWLIIRFNIENYAWQEYFVDIPVFWIQTLSLLLVSKWLIENYLIRKKNYFLLIVLATFSLWFISFLSMLSGDFTRHGTIEWEKLLPIGELIIFNINNSVFNLCIPLSLIAAKKYYEYQLNMVQYATAQKELELKVLRAQFDPHFLYNSLNTIDALIDYSSKEKIKQYVSNLASLYRHLVKMKDEEVVLVEEEITLTKNYLFLVETRFENSYDFSFDLSFSPKNKYLPNGALLTLVENIVKHNYASAQEKIKAEIKINPDFVQVSNSKSSKRQVSDESLGTGLQNLRKCYELLSDKNIEIIDTAQAFKVSLPLLKVID